MKLGLLPVIPADLARAPRLGAQPMASRTPAAVLDRSNVAFAPRMFGNNTLNDCTAAALGNTALAVGALDGFQPIVTGLAVQTFYAAVSGYIPGQPGTDVGAVLTRVMAYQACSGFHTGADLLTGPWATFDPQDQRMHALAMETFGVGNVGVALSLADIAQAQVGAPWDTAPVSGYDNTPGSAGLHDLLTWDYAGLGDTDFVRLPTWGGFQKATWRWLLRAAVEAHVIAWRPLLKTAGTNWTGVDYAAMAAETATFGAP